MRTTKKIEDEIKACEREYYRWVGYSFEWDMRYSVKLDRLKQELMSVQLEEAIWGNDEE